MPESQQPGRRSPTGTLIAAGAVTVLLVAGVIAIQAAREPQTLDDPDESSTLLLDEDFSETSERWSPDSYAGITSVIEDGGYRVLLGRRDQSWREATSFENGVEQVAVRVDARVVLESATEGAAIGLTCESNPGEADDVTGLFGHYEGVIDLEGRARIVRNLNDDEEVLVTTTNEVELQTGEPIDLALTCTNVDDETKVSFEVNGRRVTNAVERGPLAGFEGAGMSAATAGPGLEVRFDMLRATALPD